jgi:hypothetical protein
MTRGGVLSLAGRLPDFVVVGAPKAGTSSLARYLSLHPDVHMSRPKEPNFFNDAAHYGRWNRGALWYRAQFRSGKAVCGEASPGYAAWPARPRVAERMQATIPAAKLIYLVREPLGRLRSHYLMQVRQGRFEGSFDAFTASPAAADAQCASRYGTQLRHFLQFYPMDRILIVESAALSARRNETMASIFRFLGVDHGFSSEGFSGEYNSNADKTFPDARGVRLLRSAPVRLLQWALPRRAFWKVRRALMAPFAGDPPPASLSPGVEASLRAEYQDEVALLRELSGLPLPSLDSSARRSSDTD